MLVLHGVLNFEDFFTGVVPTGPRKGIEQDKHNQIGTPSCIKKVTKNILEIYMKLPIILTCEAPEGAETRELTLLLRALLENRET